MRPLAMDPTTRARARLFLRSEAAHGQQALPLRKSPRAGGPSAAKGEKIAPPAQKSPAKADLMPSKAAPKSAMALQQAPPVMREAGGADSMAAFAADSALALPPLDREEKIRLLAQLEEEQVRNCPKCRLAQTRTQT